MDVRLTAEERALRDSVVRVVQRLAPKTVGDLDDKERADKLDSAVAASGWRGLRTAGEEGKPWASGVAAAIVAEELARGGADAPYLGPVLAAELRRLSGAAAAVSCETVALTTDLGRAGVGVAVDSAGAVNAVGVRGDDVVELSVGHGLPSIDLTRPSSATGAQGATVGALTGEGLARWMALGLAISCADLVGVMRGTLEMSIAYAKVRSQYGAPIGSFQAVQHLLADAHVAMEGSRSIGLYAAWAVDALPARESLAAAAAAKGYCSRAARSVCETAIQVHGGIGNTWECMAHVFLRRAVLSSDVLGGVGPNLDRVLAYRSIGAGDGLW